MDSFGKYYSQYYDLVYQDKNYLDEVTYVCSKLGNCVSVFEMGSGTGRHAVELARLNMEVHGIDLSSTMTEQAKRSVSKESSQIGEKIVLKEGDARFHDFEREFDGGLSLFHVASYQTHNDDLERFLANAHKHLRQGGRFVFDFWYGPAVLHLKATPRVKRFENDEVKIIRVAEPYSHSSDNTITVKYDMIVHDLKEDRVVELSESHKMRYFFIPELKYYLNKLGFEVLEFCEWMKETQPSEQSWSVCAVAQKKQ